MSDSSKGMVECDIPLDSPHPVVVHSSLRILITHLVHEPEPGKVRQKLARKCGAVEPSV